ncbi:PSB27 [Auxenochlorella protothecoides x Auxenochlorella symbiontica]
MDLKMAQMASTRVVPSIPRCASRAPARKCVVSVQAQQSAPAISRRAAGAGVLSLLMMGQPMAAKAFLGIGEGNAAETEYQQLTEGLIKDILNVSQLSRDAPDRENVLKEIKDRSTAWVAKYRRQGSVQGRPSFANTYSAVNAIAGHINSFGFSTPVPKKRLDRIVKDLTDAERQLQRGR